MSQDKRSRAPQERAAEHLKKLLRSAALGGAALGISSGCSSPMVCDPLPPPICDNSPTTATFMNQGVLSSSAVWQQRDAGGLAVHVELTLSDYQKEGIGFVGDAAVSGAALLGASHDSATARFDFLPDQGVLKVEAVLELSCNKKAEALKLAFDVSNPGAGNAVTVSSLE